MEEKYAPQGYASAQGVLITSFIGILASFVLPIFYIILGRLIPNIWFIAICALLLGMFLGFMVDLGIRIGKIRNFKVALGIAIICGLLAFYVQWVFFDAIIYSRRGFTFNQSAADLKQLISDMGYLFIRPVTLFNEMAALNEMGTFRIERTQTVSGALLWLLWAGEFVVIVGSTIYVVATGQVKKPYSELNDEWMKPRKPNLYIPQVSDKDHFLTQLQNRNFDVLKNNPDVLERPDYAEVLVYESTGDPVKYITVVNVNVPSTKKKELKKKIVITHFPIPNNANV